MIIKPSVTELLTKAKNRYELVIATSKRARQIAEGDEPLIKIKDKSPVTIAANEIADEQEETSENAVEENEKAEETTEEQNEESEEN